MKGAKKKAINAPTIEIMKVIDFVLVKTFSKIFPFYLEKIGNKAIPVKLITADAEAIKPNAAP